MKILPFIRNKSFWALDALKGGKVNTAYNTIKELDLRDSDDPFIKDYHKNAWQKLREHAVSETDFYKQYKNYERLEDFPIITKNDLRSNQDTFLSKEYDKNSLIQMSTSGSTGTPFVCYQNTDKKKWVNAEIIYYSEKVGYKLGDNLSYIRTIVKQNKKSGLKQFLQNQKIINCRRLDDEGVETLVNELKRESKRNKVTLLAYGSTYKSLSDYIKRKGTTSIPELKLTGAISGSDMLFDDVRQHLSNAFSQSGGAFKMVSRYSNEENGVIGQDDSKNNVFEINEASYIVEILDDEGQPVLDGSLGHIVVTDLYNYAMPMIRYDTGDVGSVEYLTNNGRKKKCIGSFSGRKTDVIYDVSGCPLSPHTITNNMWEFVEIKQFQVVQTGKAEYEIRLNVSNDFSREKVLLMKYKEIFGDTAAIKIIYVDEIPVLNSGKRRYIVNEMKG